VAEKSKRELGNLAEELACQYLINQGWEILERNYYAGHAEVDIISREADIIVFLEVKMRSTSFFGSPVEHVSESKVKRVFDAAERWVQENNMDNQPLRFDVIGILSNNSKPEITHLRDAFR
jgi:putative endonuclease